MYSYVTYALHRIRMLQHYGVRPYVVFDGGHLPSKQGTERERAERREQHRKRGLQYMAENRGSAARDAFSRCVDVTPQMAAQLIRQLRAENIPYVVAPYEADAQLAYLEQEGLIDGIISEDSDLLVFGCKTVLFKLDTYGNCVEIQQERFAQAKQVSLAGWSREAFRQMAILSGCDYLPSIAGMGLKNAHRLLRRHESIDKVLKAVRLEGKMHVPPMYEEEFRRAELTFAHQRVWDPRGNGCLCTLAPLPSGITDALVPFIGAPIPWELARGIALGDVDPITRERIVLTATASSVPARPAKSPKAPDTKRAQPSIHTFFQGTVRRPQARTPLAELDTNAQEAPAPAATPAAAPRASRFFTQRTPETHGDSSTDSATDSLFDAPRPQTPTTSPEPACASPAASCSSPTSPKARPDEADGIVSSPPSSPVRSPRASTPATRRKAGAFTTPASAQSLTLHRRAEAANSDERPSLWRERFSFSGARTRHIALPGTSPAADAASPTQLRRPAVAAQPSTPRLAFAARSPAPEERGAKRAAEPLPAPSPKRVQTPEASLRVAGHSRTPAAASRLAGNTHTPEPASSRLLQFRYAERPPV